MKKLISITLMMMFLIAVLVGCSNTDKPADATETTSTIMDDIPVEMADDVIPEDVTTDEDGNEVVVGKDTDGNTVEIKKDKDGNVTKTVTDKETGKKTEQTTTVPTTKKQETTTKKKSEETTKKPETTTKKPTQNTTTKPASQTQTTSTHTHKFVKKSKQVLVKEAWDEDIYETKQKMEEMQCFYCCGCHVDCRLEAQRLGYANYQAFHVDHAFGRNGLSCPCTYDNGYSMLSGASFGAPTHKMYPVYENGKPVYEKVKTGTKHHDAEYRTEYWEECSCGAKR